jgi:hypothetical protein
MRVGHEGTVRTVRCMNAGLILRRVTATLVLSGVGI